jgi:hypothetical protein
MLEEGVYGMRPGLWKLSFFFRLVTLQFEVFRGFCEVNTSFIFNYGVIFSGDGGFKILRSGMLMEVQTSIALSACAKPTLIFPTRVSRRA